MYYVSIEFCESHKLTELTPSRITKSTFLMAHSLKFLRQFSERLLIRDGTYLYTLQSQWVILFEWHLKSHCFHCVLSSVIDLISVEYSYCINLPAFYKVPYKWKTWQAFYQTRTTNPTVLSWQVSQVRSGRSETGKKDTDTEGIN